jgi:hypothetical protein
MHSPRLNMLFESRRCDLTSVNVTRLDLWFMMVRQAGEATKSGAKLIGKSATVLSESPSGSPRNSNIPRRWNTSAGQVNNWWKVSKARVVLVSSGRWWGKTCLVTNWFRRTRGEVAHRLHRSDPIRSDQTIWQPRTQRASICRTFACSASLGAASARHLWHVGWKWWKHRGSSVSWLMQAICNNITV